MRIKGINWFLLGVKLLYIEKNEKRMKKKYTFVSNKIVLKGVVIG